MSKRHMRAVQDPSTSSTRRWDYLTSCVLCLSFCALPAVANGLDPTTADCLAATEKATTLRRQHQLRAARAELLICAAGTCPADIRQECMRRVDEVNASMPTMVFEVKDDKGSDMSAVHVELDGEVLTDRLEGTALSIDPGEHVFHFEAAGMIAVDRQFVIRVGEKERREQIRFRPIGAQNAAPAVLTSAPSMSTRQQFSTAHARPEPSHALRTVGYVLGGVGLAAIALAAYEQSVALNRHSSSRDAANADDAAIQATSSELHAQARSAQNYALVSGSLGLAALGVGVYMALRDLGDESSTRQEAARWEWSPYAGRPGAGVHLRVRW
jgi:hypothetical protein